MHHLRELKQRISESRAKRIFVLPNRWSSESHQACLNGRVANEDGKANKKEHYLRREFASCNYELALSLPEDVEKDKIGAKVENGVLHITLPRTAKAEKETKRIEVA